MTDLSEQLRLLALSPLSCKGISKVDNLLRVVNRRYPNGNPSEHEQASRDGPVDQLWIDYTRRLSESLHPPNDEITPSMLSLAHGRSINTEIVDAYLELLRPRSLAVEIAKIRHLGEGGVEIRSEGVDRPTIIPFKRASGWAFSVAYADCVHWYDSGPSAVPGIRVTDSRPVMARWTGPKQSEAADSGIFMLMGIRRLHKGEPHVDQEDQEACRKTVFSFRARVLVELLCNMIDPDDEEFQKFLSLEAEADSLFFQEASFGLEPRPGNSRSTAAITPPESSRATNNSMSGVSSPESAYAAAEPPDVSPSPAQPFRGSARPPTSSQALERSDHRKLILGHLHRAVLACRCTGPSTSHLAVLWNVVQQGTKSTFHERYNAVLFYNRMRDIGSRESLSEAMYHPSSQESFAKMKAVQAQCKFWGDLCDLREAWGDRKYCLLLAVPRNVMGQRVGKMTRERFLSSFRDRLSNPADTLESDLRDVSDICNAVVNRSLPREVLMIDLYRLKRPDDLWDDDSWNAFISLDPHFRRPLPQTAAS